MNIFQEFLSQYGATIIYAVLTAIAGYIGIVAKKLYVKYFNDQTKREVVRTCVRAVEQIYKELHGEEKYQKALEGVRGMLAGKEITVSDLELRMLIEAALAEYNKAFEKTAGATESAA